MKAKITSKKTMVCAANELTVEDIKDFLEDLIPNDKVQIRYSMGDRPGEISTVTFEAETSSR